MITISEEAKKHFTDEIAKRGGAKGIRVGVKTAGCSGLQYVLEFCDEIEEDIDTVFDNDGLNIIVDTKSLVYLDGTELAFTKQGVNEGFEFRNPNVKNMCGCGESFTV